MNHERERVHGFSGQQDVEFHQVRRLIFKDLVVERRIPARPALELVEIVHDQLGQRHLVVHLDSGRGKILHVLEVRPPSLGKLHYRPYVVRRYQDSYLQIRLLDPLHPPGVGHVLWRMDVHHLTGSRICVVLDARRGRQQIQVELTFQPLLDHFHMKQAEETDPEAEAERV